ncbi:hypothetical protein OJ998_31045 [Solirubrobacter taibaiensis]|nr:hypothetical protein [Solirubrobacter taibaiensis]
MRRLLVVPAVLLGGAALPCTASAQIVKAPTGETSSLKVASSQTKTFKKNKLTFSATGAAKKSGSTLTLPYSLSRWDFGTREGDVAYYAKKTGFKLKRGKRTATAINPRLVLDTPKSGYISMLISNERIKFFTVSGAKAKAADSGNVQQTTGYTLKLTQAGANYVNRALRKKALKRFSQFGTLDVRIIRPAATPQPGTPGAPGGGAPGQGDVPGGTATINPGFLGLLPGGGQITPLIPGGALDLDGDGNPDLGVTVLPLESADVDVATKTGTIKLGGGLVLDVPGLGSQIALVNPEVVLGTNAGLYAEINGVRVKVGDIDTDTLDLNVADGTVTIKDLDVTVGGALNTLLAPVLGVLPANTPLLQLDLSFPEV